MDETLATNWSVFDVGIGIEPSFDFDAQGRVHVMGMMERLDGEVWYDVADTPAGPWTPNRVGAQEYFYGPGDIRVGADSTAHLAWHDHDLENAKHVRVQANKIKAMQFGWISMRTLLRSQPSRTESWPTGNGSVIGRHVGR